MITKMIDRKDLLAMAFYERSPFTGSYGNMRYRIEKITVKDETVEDATEEKKLQATIWPGPYCFDATADDVKITHVEDFSDEGMDAITDWLNTKHDEIFNESIL